MRTLVGHRVDEPDGEQFLVHVFDDGTATVATRPTSDRSVRWSAPVALREERS